MLKEEAFLLWEAFQPPSPPAAPSSVFHSPLVGASSWHTPAHRSSLCIKYMQEMPDLKDWVPRTTNARWLIDNLYLASSLK